MRLLLLVVESPVMILSNSEPSIDKASRLLNAQAMNLDELEVSQRDLYKFEHSTYPDGILDPFDGSARLAGERHV